MKRRLLNTLTVLAFGLAAAAPGLPGIGDPRDDAYHGWADDTLFTVTQVRPGVYFAVGGPGQVVGANSTFIVTDRDVILVDDHITPRAARALLERIRGVTDKPLRYVVDTHFHGDHTSGNGIFGPDVEIISHPATRAKLLASGAESIRQQVEALPAQIAALRARRDTTSSDSLRRVLDRQVSGYQAMLEQYRTLTVTLPTATVDSSLVLYRGGGQEIRIFYMGRGHTAGDVVVQLPRESLLVSGDLVTNAAGPPFMADGYPAEWGATVRRLATLAFHTTLPGHGQPFEGKERYEATAAFMDDVWHQAQALIAQGVTRDQLGGRLDLARHLTTYPALRGGLNPANVQRIFDLATGAAH